MDTSLPTILVVTQVFPSPGTSPHSGTFVRQALGALKTEFRPIVLVPYPVRLIESWKSFNRPKVSLIDELEMVSFAYSPHLILLVQLIKHLVTQPAATIEQLKKEPLNLLRLWIKEAIAAQLAREAHRLNQQYHFSLVYGQEVFVGDEAGPIGKQLQLPSVVTIHALYPFHVESFGLLVMERVVANLAQASQLTTVSRLAEQTYSDKVDQPIAIVPNGYRLDKAAKPNQSLIQLATGRTVLLYVGFLIESKRVDLLIKSVAQLRERFDDKFVLAIVGDGPQRQSLIELAERLQVADQVAFLGQVPPDQLAGYYLASDIVVQPSQSDSFSMVCLEAMAYGKPFICTDQAGIAEYVTNEKEAFIVPADNQSALTEKLGILLGDKQLRAAMGRVGQITAAKLTPEAAAKQMAQLFTKLLDEEKHGEK